MGNGLTRRKFLALSGLGIAGAALAPGLPEAAMMGGGGMGGGGMGGGGTTIINPPVGAAFRDLPVLPYVDGRIQLDVTEASININGTRANLMTYNGLFPGGTIKARSGDILKVRLTNRLPYTAQTNLLGHTRNITNLHTHGLHVSPEEPADSMMVMLKPGESYDYVYDLMHEPPGHLNLYHPHVHGTVAEQFWAGLVGAIDILDDTAALSGYDTHTMIIKDISIVNGAPAPHDSMMVYMHGMEGNTVMVNGQVNPLLSIKPGQVQRWKIVNACNARYLKLSLEGHSMQLVGTDGGLLDKPYPVSSIILAPAERIDVLVKGGSKGNYRLLSLPYSRGGMSPLQQVTLLTMSSGGARINDLLPAAVNPDAKRLVMDTGQLPKKTLTLSMGQGRGYINGISFTDMDHTCTAMSDIGTYEVWEIINQSGMDHPFHQHVNEAQVLSITGGDAAYASLYTKAPAWKDVVNIPKWGSVKLLMPVMDYTGMAMFHCHILEHEDIGMLGVWHLMDGMPM